MKDLRAFAGEGPPEKAGRRLSGYTLEQLEAFAARLTEYKTSKGTIQFPYSKPLPLELIGEIAKWCEKNI
ncbi:hypothetical protein AALA54_05880 [Oscillospiraceae bacterium 44-34]